MPRFDIDVRGKITFIEGQDPFDSMNVHGSHQACIMNLETSYLMGDNQPPPFPMHVSVVGKKIQCVLDRGSSGIRFAGS